MRMTRLRIPIAAGLAGLLSLALPLAARDVTVVLKEKRIRDLRGTGLVLVFHLEVANAGAEPVDLVRTRYRVVIGAKEFLNMDVALDSPLRVAGGDRMLVGLPVKITYALLEAAVGPLGDRASCELVGELVFRNARTREERVPVALTGEFPIFQEPVLSFRPLRVKGLTVGGADFIFEASFANANPYELIVERLTYRLDFGETTVQSGDAEGDKSFPPRGERPVVLAFLLDFFEVGKPIYELLQKEALPVRFAGEVEIASVWGRLVIPFDGRETLAISRVAEEPRRP
jgi:hypothetical protein